MLFLGRGTSFPLAMEAALKLKEISYIHAEGYAAGELKHGPIALIDEAMPVIVMAPRDPWFREDRLQRSGGGRAWRRHRADRAGRHQPRGGGGDHRGNRHARHGPGVLGLRLCHPAQLIAYHTAVVMGKDVDQPRNLAKSVTVE